MAVKLPIDQKNIDCQQAKIFAKKNNYKTSQLLRGVI